ncbi:uncharacterized protein LOC106011813 [Aplysia californica]|uniref:Uncharacterized protein LOC106011813 n=1 Tax=Aplysia californica TaxID=6500 RepID=A0ABM1A0C5_APLCA|nr:uncharacterized protein LOC106011813 [Aplysia californica]
MMQMAWERGTSSGMQVPFSQVPPGLSKDRAPPPYPPAHVVRRTNNFQAPYPEQFDRLTRPSQSYVDHPLDSSLFCDRWPTNSFPEPYPEQSDKHSRASEYHSNYPEQFDRQSRASEYHIHFPKQFDRHTRASEYHTSHPLDSSSFPPRLPTSSFPEPYPEQFYTHVRDPSSARWPTGNYQNSYSEHFQGHIVASHECHIDHLRLSSTWYTGTSHPNSMNRHGFNSKDYQSAYHPNQMKSGLLPPQQTCKDPQTFPTRDVPPSRRFLAPFSPRSEKDSHRTQTTVPYPTPYCKDQQISFVPQKSSVGGCHPPKYENRKKVCSVDLAPAKLQQPQAKDIAQPRFAVAHLPQTVIEKAQPCPIISQAHPQGPLPVLDSRQRVLNVQKTLQEELQQIRKDQSVQRQRNESPTIFLSQKIQKQPISTQSLQPSIYLTTNDERRYEVTSVKASGPTTSDVLTESAAVQKQTFGIDAIALDGARRQHSLGRSCEVKPEETLREVPSQKQGKSVLGTLQLENRTKKRGVCVLGKELAKNKHAKKLDCKNNVAGDLGRHNHVSVVPPESKTIDCQDTRDFSGFSCVRENPINTKSIVHNTKSIGHNPPATVLDSVSNAQDNLLCGMEMMKNTSVVFSWEYDGNQGKPKDSKHGLFAQFSCPVCAISCDTEFCLLAHLNENHGEIESIVCALCSKSIRKLSLFRHLNAMHLNSCCQFVCGGKFSGGWKCSFTSTDSAELLRHMELNHNQEDVFDCHRCGSEITGALDLIVHQKSLESCNMIYAPPCADQEIKVENEDTDQSNCNSSAPTTADPGQGKER